MTRLDRVLKLLEEYDDLVAVAFNNYCVGQDCRKMLTYLRQEKAKLTQELIEHEGEQQMLKAYKVKTDISVNGQPKKRIYKIGYGLTDKKLPRTVTTTWSFQDCFDKQLPTPAVKTDTTLFRKRPYVEIEYSWDKVDRHYNFDSIIIERHYEPYDITLNELIKEYSADECIQYLKERGMTACPILK